MMESRFGPLGSGKQALSIRGETLDAGELLHRMGLDFDDAKPIDLIWSRRTGTRSAITTGRTSAVVAHEFDGDLKFVEETRAHVAEWIGEEAYFALFGGH